jgi:hypothetical protein
MKWLPILFFHCKGNSKWWNCSSSPQFNMGAKCPWDWTVSRSCKPSLWDRVQVTPLSLTSNNFLAGQMSMNSEPFQGSDISVQPLGPATTLVFWDKFCKECFQEWDMHSVKKWWGRRTCRFGFKWIFIRIPPALYPETFLASLYILRPARNPLFEAISLLIPTGPLHYQFL